MSVAWVAVGTAVVGTAVSANSASKARKAQQSAADASIEQQRDATAAQLEAQRPFLEGGYTANNRLLELLGLGGNKDAAGYGSANAQFSFTPGDLTQAPGYQFQLQQGQEALDRKAAAGGGFYSGAALKAAQGFGQNLASTTFDNEYNRAFNAFQTNRANTLNPLQSLSGQGQTAANTSANIQQNGANALSSLLTSNANSQGAAAISQGNAISNGLSGGLSAWQQANYLNKLQQQPVGYGLGGTQGSFTQWGSGGGFGSGFGGMGD
jgi:hypothetical protein